MIGLFPISQVKAYQSDHQTRKWYTIAGMAVESNSMCRNNSYQVVHFVRNRLLLTGTLCPE